MSDRSYMPSLACGQKLRLCFYYTFCCYCFSKNNKSTKDYVAFTDADTILATSQYAGARDTLEYKYGQNLRSNQLTAVQIDATTTVPDNLGRGYAKSNAKTSDDFKPTPPTPIGQTADPNSHSTSTLAHQLAAAKSLT